MQIELEFPDIGIVPNDEITISFWHIEEDEEFEEGDDILEVSTNKSTFDVPAPCKGRLIEILVQEGDIVTMGDTIALIET
jgi:pyruvate/2-oxoglutarate dehydrogenase complex dihydrolipoamide acyltransferase (E2) component